MAYNFDAALKSGLDEQKIRSYLDSKGRGMEADTYFGKPRTKLGTGIVADEKSVGGFVSNVFSSGGKFIKDTASAIVHPVETVKSVAKVGAGAVEKLIPGEQGQEKNFDALVEHFKGRYGSTQAFLDTLYNDPVGAASDVSLFMGAGAGALKLGSKVAKVAGATNIADDLARAGQTASRAATITNPITGTAKAVKAIAGTTPVTKAVSWAKESAKNLYAELHGAATGTGGGGAIREGITAVGDDASRKAFIDAARGNISGNEIRDGALKALKEWEKAKSDEFKAASVDLSGKADVTETIRKIDSAVFDKEFNIARVSTKKGTKFDFSDSSIPSADKGAVNDVLKRVESLSKGENTFQDVQLAKEFVGGTLSKMKESTKGRTLVSKVYDNLSEQLRTIPGYESRSNKYRDAVNQIKEVRRELSLNRGANVQTGIKKLATALRDNNEFRGELVKMLENVTEADVRNLVAKIAGFNLKSKTPSGITRQLIIGGVGGGVAVTGGISSAIIPLLVVTSPRVAAEFLNAVGVSQSQILKIMKVIGEIDALKKAGSTVIKSAPALRTTEQIQSE